MPRVNLVRHGQARADQEDYDQLSELGLRQSRLLGAWLASRGLPVGDIVCGTLKRHRQTAEACLEAWGADCKITVDSGFDEYDHREILARGRPDLADHGELTRHLLAQAHPGRAFQEIFAASVERWVSGEEPTEYRESWSGFRDRCFSAVRRVAAAGQDVWVFTSGGPIAAILQAVLGVDDRKAIELSWSILNGSVTSLVGGRTGIRLFSFNGVAHLENEADASIITGR